MATNPASIEKFNPQDPPIELRQKATQPIRFVQGWPLGRIVGKKPDERLTRDEMNARIQRRAASDESFMKELLANPRYVYALAVEESLSIFRFLFMSSIDSVDLLHETPERLYIVLPSCHRGCQVTPTQPPEGTCEGSCHVCGMTFPIANGIFSGFAQPEASTGEALSRREIEDLIKKNAALDDGFKGALMSRPVETYTAFAARLCGGAQPDYLKSVREIHVLEETARNIYFVLPALSA